MPYNIDHEDKDPYAEGYEAFKAGKKDNDNPYKDPIERNLWVKGYYVALRAKEEGIEV